MLSIFLCLEDVFESDVVVVHSLLQMKNIQFPEWWKSPLKDSTNLKKRNLSQEVVCTKGNVIFTSQFWT